MTEAEKLRLIYYAGKDLKNMSAYELDDYGNLLEERLREIEEEERRDREAPTGVSVDTG
jgi:hypothetical protein